MEKYAILTIAVLLLGIACQEDKQVPAAATEEARLIDYVDPFIGTADHGHVYPGATVPFGMVQLSPDNGTQGWDWCSGYNWADSLIVGFSHTHLSGTGIGDLCDISIMPNQSTIDFSRKIAPRESSYAAAFSHDREKAHPGYYEVQLDNGIKVQLTTSSRAGLHQYTFPQGKEAKVLIDLGFAINWDKATNTQLKIDAAEGLITGHRFSKGWAKDQRVFFAAQFSEPLTSFQLADSTALLNEVTEAQGLLLRAQLNFGAVQTLQVKVGLSSSDPAGALAALKEIPDWDFAQVQQQAAERWEKELSKIKIQTDDEEARKIFYTSLYRTCLAPVLMSDALGQYKGADGKVHHAQDFTRYDIFSLWDTFRATNPLHTLTQPDKVNDFIESMLSHYDQHGLLPVWSLLGNETNTMTGYHAVPVIVDAYQKGFRDYDVLKAYEAMKTSAMQDIRGTNFYREFGYIPYEKNGQSVTKTLEYAYDDWCIAQMAKAIGEEEDHEQFMKRAASYRQLFDSATGFMRAKYADKKWKTPFDPQFSDHNFDVAEYTEGNAWQHSWFVPHDPGGLIGLHGGDRFFVTKLDSLFTVDSEIKGENASVDISGLIGQYAHGNEPSHHIAYLYSYAGRPWRTQERVREILTSQYNATPTGLCGNEDCGQMSAWYVFSALGFYPVNPAEGIYVLGSPMFEEATLNTNGKTFRLIAKGASATNKYIQSAQLNGQPYDKTYITHDAVVKGGTLTLEMGPSPNTDWGTAPNSRPPSMAR
ncbi:MAG: GH92 family glycosyl hydrolase [Bacteroidota bacterium]